jgi:hypothetical protein
MSSIYSPVVTPQTVSYKALEVDGITITYREAGDVSKPKLVLLHGFPSSSHQYRNLIPALAGRFHVISPDYPGFGNSDTPDPAKFPLTSWPKSSSTFSTPRALTNSGCTSRTTVALSASASSAGGQTFSNGSSCRIRIPTRSALLMLGADFATPSG